MVDPEDGRTERQWRCGTETARLSIPVFGHCSLQTPDGQGVVVTGGFDGEDYINKVQAWDPLLGSWSVTTGQLNEPRYDHSCKATTIRYT